MKIKYEIRDNRNGYKAGALREGMKRSYVKECDYVAIFDADFQPEPAFLCRTIPFLVHNPDIALVQARASPSPRASPAPALEKMRARWRSPVVAGGEISCHWTER